MITPLLKNKEYYQFEHFSVFNDLVCAYSSRHLKNMSLVYADTTNSLQNRQNFLNRLGIDCQDLVCAKQIHGSNIRYVDEEDRGRGASSYANSIEDTDALITDKKNLPLAIFTADCLSIFIYDPQRPAVALVHAGWKGTKENIVSKTLQLMQERFNSILQNLYIGFGPSIRACCYEVKKEFGEFFPYGLVERDGHFYLDLIYANKNEALDSGVEKTHIFDSGVCTSCHNEDFFSYRREGNACGRIISAIMLK